MWKKKPIAKKKKKKKKNGDPVEMSSAGPVCLGHNSAGSTPGRIRRNSHDVVRRGRGRALQPPTNPNQPSKCEKKKKSQENIPPGARVVPQPGARSLPSNPRCFQLPREAIRTETRQRAPRRRTAQQQHNETHNKSREFLSPYPGSALGEYGYTLPQGRADGQKGAGLASLAQFSTFRTVFGLGSGVGGNTR